MKEKKKKRGIWSVSKNYPLTYQRTLPCIFLSTHYQLLTREKNPLSGNLECLPLIKL